MDYELEYKRLIEYISGQKEFYKEQCRKGRKTIKHIEEEKYLYAVYDKLAATTEYLKDMQ